MAILDRGASVSDEKGGPGFTARACASTYVVVVGIWVIPLFLAVYSAVKHANGALLMVEMLGCGLAVSLFWAGRFQISIDGGTICYRSLLGGTRKLALNEIDKAEISFDVTRRVGPVYKLIFWPQPQAQKTPAVINMKVFGKADLNRVFDFLRPKLTSERRFTLTSTERETLLRNIP